jgi:hypothetical protein
MCTECADELPCGRELGAQSAPLLCDGELALAEIGEYAPRHGRCVRS